MTIRDDRVDDLASRLVELPPGEREDAMRAACGDDHALLSAVTERLRAFEEALEFLEELQRAYPVATLSDVIDAPGRVDPLAAIGTQISHYRVEEYLGGGGMGLVYRARDLNMRRDAAIKLLPPNISRSELTVQRFRREAAAASSLDHPHIATIYEVGESDFGQLFIAMAYYDGETLKNKVARGPLPVESAVQYALEMSSALADAHAHGIIHRDVKPANVMVTRSGKSKLLDFGVAKVSDLSSLTDSDSAVGTAAYMAPEQAQGFHVSGATDLWALGLTLYEMLAGVHPFASSYAAATVYRICNEDPEDLALLCPDAPDELVALVRSCLEKDPSDRPASAEIVRDRLDVLLRGMRGLPFEPVARRVPGWHVAAAVVIALAVVVSVVLALTLSDRRPPVFEGTSLAILPVEPDADSPDAVPASFVSGVSHMLSEAGSRLDRSVPDLFIVPQEDLLQNEVRSAGDARSQFYLTRVLTPRIRSVDGGFEIVLTLADAESDRVLAEERVHYATAGQPLGAEVVLESVARALDLEIDSEAVGQLRTGGTTVLSAWQFFNDAQQYLQQFEETDNLMAAASLLERAIVADSGYVRAYVSLAETYRWVYNALSDTSWFFRAVAAGERAIELGPDLAEAKLALGTTHLERGQLNEAELAFFRAAEQDPRLAAAHAGLAAVFMQTRRHDQAIAAIKRAINARPGYWFYHNRLGQYLNSTGRFAEAIEAFEQTIARHPTNPWGYNNLGAVYQGVGDLDEALRQYRLAANANSRATRPVAHALRNIGGVHYTRRDFDEASRAYRDAITVDSTHLESWDLLGNASVLAGDREGAFAAWERVLRTCRERLALNPQDAEMLEYAAEVHAKRGEAAQALEYAERLVPIAERSASAPLSLGTTFELLGDRERALQYIAVALENPWARRSVWASVFLDSLRVDPRFEAMAAPYGDPDAESGI